MRKSWEREKLFTLNQPLIWIFNEPQKLPPQGDKNEVILALSVAVVNRLRHPSTL